MEINKEILFDIKPDMSWSIPAIAAEPVIVTRPRLSWISFPMLVLSLASFTL